MAFNYRINLVRDAVVARKAKGAIFHVVRAALFVFVMLSLGTFLIFYLRNYRVATDRETIRKIAAEMKDEGIDLEKVATLSTRSEGLDLQLAVLREVLSDTASWSRVLATLGTMCEATQIKLRRIHTDSRGTVASLYLEGICNAPDAIGSVRAFLDNVSHESAFGGGVLRTIDMESGDSLFFRAEIPLLAPVPPEPEPKKEDKTS